MKVVGTGRSAGGGVVFEGDGDGGGVLVCRSWVLEKGGIQTNARVRLVGPPIGESVPIHSRLVRGSMNMMWKPSLMGTAR